MDNGDLIDRQESESVMRLQVDRAVQEKPPNLVSDFLHIHLEHR